MQQPVAERQARSRVPESQDQIEALIEQFEGATRKLAGRVGFFVTAVAVASTIYHLLYAYSPLVQNAQQHRTIHLALMLALSFLWYPGWRGARGVNALDWLWIGLTAFGLGWIFWDYEQFVYRQVTPTRNDILFGVATILVILEATRRTTGWTLVVTASLFIAYALFGQYLPEPWMHRGYDVERLIGHLYVGLEGIFGVPLDVAATFIILFTIYGSFLEQSGAGKFFVDLALAIVRKRRTGAGQAVTVASFLLGGPSGSGVATTVTVGAIAYPMLKRSGYSAEAAGGLLSAGGIGAVISPPILGAAAFIIAEILKISYLQVLVLAAIPTVLYYLSIFFMIEMDARRFGLRSVPIEAESAWALARRYWYLLTSLITIPLFMMLGRTAIAAVFWSTVIAWLTSYLRRDTALLPAKLTAALANGTKQVLSVSVTCAVAGIIVGVITLTGLGLKLSGIIIDFGGGNLLMTLIYSGIALWVLGLALPITATYIIAAAIVAPALIKLGVHELAAHMFIFYYAILSEVSPPVGLSPLAASALTGGNTFRTMMMAWKYTLPAFVVPFMFTVHPSGMGLLLQAPPLAVAKVTVTAVAGLGALAAGVSGWLLHATTPWERAALVTSGLLLVYPESSLDLLAFGVIAAVFFLQWRSRRQSASTHTATP
ncbi:MAG: TRAP transporter fused permease subunit [Armatimonadetes bacterium]|nr:TRAP transporter fused permease subunit [Armatimonadota bacterium]